MQSAALPALIPLFMVRGTHLVHSFKMLISKDEVDLNVTYTVEM
jgi:hypothetical protein